MFGSALETAYQFAEILATDGVQRGLIGPREAPRLWDRHLLNCAVVADLLPEAGELVDIGSGAGLPGVVLAMLRPGIRVVLLEPMLRRSAFLEECLARLDLPNATVVRGRAEDIFVITEMSVVHFQASAVQVPEIRREIDTRRIHQRFFREIKGGTHSQQFAANSAYPRVQISRINQSFDKTVQQQHIRIEC